MKVIQRLIILAGAAFLVAASFPALAAEPEVKQEIPEPLKPWVGWALWDERDVQSPSPYHDPKQALRLWPSRLTLEADGTGGRFDLSVTVFSETWLPLPGDAEIWPLDVTVNGKPLPVVEHAKRPSVKLLAGDHQVIGVYEWKGMPQRIPMPVEIGILSLILDEKPIDVPVWDAQGFLWLKRDAATTQTDKDFLGIKTHSLLEDGIPMWLHTDVELIVAGKSREESLGDILPAGWKLAAVKSPIPVAVDDAGRMKAQVRAGKWTVELSAFRLDPPTEIGFAADAKPAAGEQFIAFKAKPDFRLLEISGIPAVDASQATFPDKWSQFPVYRWETATPFRLVEQMRGMGLQQPGRLGIKRELWLDQDGGGLTFRDHISGEMKQIRRLDAADGQELGSVRFREQGQLITRNPADGSHGVEVRSRELDHEATGRMAVGHELPASGWRTDAEDLKVTLNLPPGWRLFALFGADWVEGDWLTAWTLLDLFLLLVFTLAVFRLWGVAAALLALFGFGLTCHEPDAPRYLWLVLLIPLALLRVVPEGWGRRVLVVGKWVIVALLVLLLVPFTGKQIQQALYPQLEHVPYVYQDNTPPLVTYAPPASDEQRADPFAASPNPSKAMLRRGSWKSGSSYGGENLQYDTKARIQTGPGVPQWQWRQASYGWNGPVTAAQTVRPVLIPMGMERALSVLRVALLLGLAAALLELRRPRFSAVQKNGAALALLAALLCFTAPQAQAQIPDKEMLESLRQRLTETPDAYPTAADIPNVSLTVRERKLTMEVEIHTAIRTAVPLPGRLPTWLPQKVTVDEQPAAALRRADGFLWLVLPAGVHQVKVEGLLADLTEWQWTWKLKPRRVSIDAPEWQIGGVKSGGIPEAQVFFTREVKSEDKGANYDRPSLQSAISVERQIVLGLVWQVHTRVGRLSSEGGAVSLRIPLLPGENVLSSNAVVKEGFIEVRLGAGQSEYAWQSELGVVSNMTLATRKNDAWVERWSLVVSPVWNVGISGLAPIFTEENAQLIPTWNPWPGETATLEISRPEAISGATVTVNQATHEMELGKRQRSSSLELSVRSSMGEDFLIGLPAGAEATSLSNNTKNIPIRKEGDKVIVPLNPGEQQLSLRWKQDLLLTTRTSAEAVTLPVPSANINSTIKVPDGRWVLWTAGPLRGPAVRFWGILVSSLLVAWVLGRMAHSPLRTHEWMLLAIGLTQISVVAGLFVVGWLFLLAWRGGETFPKASSWVHNIFQVMLIVISLIALGIFIAIVKEGLLGSPEMFIQGNDSSRTVLRWFEASSEGVLPQPSCVSISIWWYRLLMLLWALWLAASLIRWLTWGWKQFNQGGCFMRAPKPATPPPLPQK